MNKLTLKVRIGDRPEPVTLRGRDAWALQALLSSRLLGVTPLEKPAPRWSHYIWKLRAAGLNIETIDEKHGGPFAGTHARYVLRSPVTIVEEPKAA